MLGTLQFAIDFALFTAHIMPYAQNLHHMR